MRRTLLAASLSALALTLLACGGVGSGGGDTRPKAEPCRATLTKYNAVTTGMSYDEVVKVMGCRGEENARTELAGHVTVIYTWQNPGGDNMNVTFQNDRVVSKAQFGLR